MPPKPSTASRWAWGKGAVYIRNTAGTCRDFLSSQQCVVHNMVILESLLTYQFPSRFGIRKSSGGFSRSRPHPSRAAWSRHIVTIRRQNAIVMNRTAREWRAATLLAPPRPSRPTRSSGDDLPPSLDRHYPASLYYCGIAHHSPAHRYRWHEPVESRGSRTEPDN
jgi:hypothetical protein